MSVCLFRPLSEKALMSSLNHHPVITTETTKPDQTLKTLFFFIRSPTMLNVEILTSALEIHMHFPVFWAQRHLHIVLLRCEHCSLMSGPYGNTIPPSFIWGLSLVVMSGSFYWSLFCIKLGCVWPKENSQRPNITHISLKSQNMFFFFVVFFPSCLVS